MEIIVKIVFEKALPFKYCTHKNNLGMFYGTKIRARNIAFYFILTIVIVAIDVTTNQL